LPTQCQRPQQTAKRQIEIHNVKATRQEHGRIESVGPHHLGEGTVNATNKPRQQRQTQNKISIPRCNHAKSKAVRRVVNQRHRVEVRNSFSRIWARWGPSMNADGDVTPGPELLPHLNVDALAPPPCTITPSGPPPSAPISVLGNGAISRPTAIAEGYVRDGRIAPGRDHVVELYGEICSVSTYHRETQPGRAQSTGERSRQPIARVRPNSAANTRRSAVAPRRWRISES